jgi:hypothetical protein
MSVDENQYFGVGGHNNSSHIMVSNFPCAMRDGEIILSLYVGCGKHLYKPK